MLKHFDAIEKIFKYLFNIYVTQIKFNIFLSKYFYYLEINNRSWLFKLNYDPYWLLNYTKTYRINKLVSLKPKRINCEVANINNIAVHKLKHITFWSFYSLIHSKFATNILQWELLKPEQLHSQHLHQNLFELAKSIMQWHWNNK